MNEYQIALAIGALICVAFSWHIPRAVLWICLGAVNFAVTTAWARSGFPYPAFFSAMADSTVCLAIFFISRERWEMGLFRIFQAMILVNFIYLLGLLNPHWAYVAILETLNWLALMLIGATAALQWVGASGDDLGNHYRRDIRRAYRTLHAQRTDHPFHRQTKK